MKYREFDLAALSEDLGKEIPEISELYLFGSRAHGTRSNRSDADVLVVTKGHIKPLQLREFSEEHCEALDLFIVDGGKAISAQNESYIEAVNLASLLRELGAIKIWSRGSGRQPADIQWRFRVKVGVEFPHTMLPDSYIGPAADDLEPVRTANLTVRELLGGLTPGQLWSVLLVVVSVITASFCAGFYAKQYLTELTDEQKNSSQPAVKAQSSIEPKTSRGVPMAQQVFVLLPNDAIGRLRMCRDNCLELTLPNHPCYSASLHATPSPSTLA